MRRRVGLGLLSLLCVSLCGSAYAAEPRHAILIGNSSTLTVEALPLEAEVRLDGVPIGSAHDLVSRPVVVVPGRHVVTVAAPGYLPATVTVHGAEDWTTRVWLKLVPNRGQQ